MTRKHFYKQHPKVSGWSINIILFVVCFSSALPPWSIHNCLCHSCKAVIAVSPSRYFYMCQHKLEPFTSRTFSQEQRAWTLQDAAAYVPEQLEAPLLHVQLCVSLKHAAGALTLAAANISRVKLPEPLIPPPLDKTLAYVYTYMCIRTSSVYYVCSIVIKLFIIVRPGKLTLETPSWIGLDEAQA